MIGENYNIKTFCMKSYELLLEKDSKEYLVGFTRDTVSGKFRVSYIKSQNKDGRFVRIANRNLKKLLSINPQELQLEDLLKRGYKHETLQIKS